VASNAEGEGYHKFILKRKGIFPEGKYFIPGGNN